MTADATLARRAAYTVAALVVLRLAVAAFLPLTFDEAYYWTWSKRLAGGYYDHAPMVAYVIRAGTLIAGDTEFGVRVVSILLVLPMTWAVYRAAEILFGSVRIAASAAIFLNVTMMVAVGSIIVTPDAPLLVASSFVLFFLAKVYETGKGAWWLAVGAAVGCALLSKYTALFFGAVILLWLVLVPSLRRWLLSPWPYLGGLLAFAMFSPVIFWNAGHQWMSFVKQLGRAKVDGMTLKYFGEMIPTQVGFATPLVFALGALGLSVLARRGTANDPARMLIGLTVGVILAYFCLHSLHARVEANWFGPVYPAFAVAAAFAAWGTAWSARTQRVVNFCRRWALPGGVALFVVLVIQTSTGFFTNYRRDPSMRSVGVGWTDVAQEIEGIRKLTGAQCVFGADYGTTSWLMFYLPKDTCVIQRGERYRWEGMPEPDAAILKGKVLLVDFADVLDSLRDDFAKIEKITEVTRKRSGTVLETYEIDLAQGAPGDPLDRNPPPEMMDQSMIPKSGSRLPDKMMPQTK